jgi:nucleotide-binding universal stress UspA family protein
MPAINCILCPVDFSDHSRHALDQAIAIGRHYGAAVTALHVIPPITPLVPSIDSPVPPPFIYSPEDLEAIRRHAVAFVDAERAEAPITTTVVEGYVVPEIVETAASLVADLIVIGTHGRSGVERLVLGSVAERVLAKARCPVMTVPPRVPDAVPTGPVLFPRILCALDFGPASQRALDLATRLASESSSVLTLLTVVEPAIVLEPVLAGAAGVVDSTPLFLSAAKGRLHDAVPPDLARRGLVREAVVAGKPYAAILEQADDLHADLIVMGAHGGLAGMLGFGSTTNHVVRRAGCPVISVRQ